MPRLLRRLLTAGAVLLGADQVLQYTALSDGELFGRRVAPFDPPLFTDAQRARFEQVAAEARGEGAARRRGFVLDPELGWRPPEGEGGKLYTYDWAGSRIADQPLARERAAGVRRIAALGCSFTRCDEVGADAAWTAVLDAGRDDVDVANLGMGGYGIDQALLRYRHDARPLEPDEVWLGYLPRASLRVLTHFPPLQHHHSTIVAFKPRFVLDEEGALALVPSPVRSPADTVRLLTDQRALIGAIGGSDTWLRRSPRSFAPSGSSWVHRLATGRLLLTLLESGDRDLEPWVEEPDSEARKLLRALIVRMASDVESDGARFRLLVLPSRADLKSRAERGRAYWDGLVTELEAARIDVLDLSTRLDAAGALEDDAFWMPGGHYSPAANRLVAETVDGHLSR